VDFHFPQAGPIFPGSLFILTIRVPYRWLTSYRAMLEAQGSYSAKRGVMRSWLYGFDVSSATDEELITRFKSHNEDVREYFKSRPNDLLVVDWEQGDVWKEICSFLKEPIPPQDFPHLNRRI
jgi:hypothetical protein